MARVFRLIEVLHPWAMMEVYLLGVIVAYVKLIDLARLELGVALYAFVALIILIVAAEAAMDPRQVWDRLGAQARARLPLVAPEALIGCHDCDQVVRIERHHRTLCPAAAPRSIGASRTASPAPGRW